MLLLDFLKQYVLIENTHELFSYRDFALRLETRYGKRVIRDDYTPTELQDVAQNTFDVNLPFFTGLSKTVINPFESWAETGTETHNSEYSDTHTPNLMDTTTVNLDDTTTPNLTDETKHTGTVADTAKTTLKGTQQNFVNAYNSDTSKARDNSSTSNDNSGSNTTTYDNADTTTHSGSTTTAHSGTNTVAHSGTDTTEHQDSGGNTYSKSGYKIDDYIKAMQYYYSFIDIVIDFIARDILYLTIRKEDI